MSVEPYQVSVRFATFQPRGPGGRPKQRLMTIPSSTKSILKNTLGFRGWKEEKEEKNNCRRYGTKALGSAGRVMREIGIVGDVGVIEEDRKSVV